MDITRFRAEHADRYARIATASALSPGDKEFLFWSHLQMLTYGEAYHQQFQLGLMPEAHWHGFSSWIDDYINSRGFDEFWASEKSSFSSDYCEWIEQKLAR